MLLAVMIVGSVAVSLSMAAMLSHITVLIVSLRLVGNLADP
jgi:hypothetical protein